MMMTSKILITLSFVLCSLVCKRVLNTYETDTGGCDR